MDNKSQGSFKSFDYEEDDLNCDPFVQKPGKPTKNAAMINPKWTGILTVRSPILEQEFVRDLHTDL